MRPLVVHVVTVPWTLHFFRGQGEYLRRRGFRVECVSSAEPLETLNDFSSKEMVPAHQVSMRRGMAPAHDLVSVFALWRVFRRLRPDIVHSHSPKAGLLGTLAAKAAGVPVVVVSIFGLVQMTKTGVSARLLNGLTRLQCRFADRVWCDSHSMARYLAAAGICPPGKIVVIGAGSVNGVEAQGEFSPEVQGPWREGLRRQLDIPVDAMVIGYVGRLNADKGLAELAEAWRLLREAVPSAYLLLVGPAEAMPVGLRTVVEQLEADPRVRAVGRTAHVAQHLAAMDVFVMPSHREGFGVVNIEAAAMRLPVVATRIPGCIDSVTDGVTGTLVPVRDAPALFEAVRAYCDNEDLRRTHGDAGRRRALSEFRPETVWEGLADLYSGLMTERRPGWTDGTET